MSLWGGLFAVGMRGENEQRSSEATQTQSLTLRSRKTCMKQEIKDIKTAAMSGLILRAWNDPISRERMFDLSNEANHKQK